MIRYGISDEQAWDVGLACGGTIDVLVSPEVPAAAVEAARETSDGRGDGRAIVTPLPADAPPAVFGEHTPGEGSARSPLVVHDDGRLEGTLGDRDADAELVEAARDALRTGTSRRSRSAAASCSSRRTRSGRGSSSWGRSRSRTIRN